MSEPNSTFKFEKYRILNSVFEVKDEDIEPTNKITVGFKTKSQVDYNTNEFELAMTMKVTDDVKSFECIISGVGFFSFTSNDYNHLQNFLSLNAPAVLYPYLRAYASTLTGLTGIRPVVLPTLNLSGMAQNILNDMVIIEKTESSEND